jgi:TRAP-type C4-dicarboxylate transport system permease small subunit
MSDLDGASARARPEGSIARADRLFGYLTETMNMIGTITIVLIAVLVVIDVIGLAFSRPLVGVNEFMQLSLPGIVFLQAANTLRERRQISSEVFIERLQRHKPRLTAFLYGFYNVIGAVFLAGIAWLLYPKMLQAYDRGFTRGAQGIIEIPEWPSMALVVLGGAVMSIQYLLHALRDLRVAATGDFSASAKPEAVAQ